ncbi:basic proline-rich protein-like [Monodelphis domestica]|uniref:basic proline-rich protein-like n=1 Tax=Monodelphis domestica TaxID=13616 RepID=UPI00028BD5B3|nr:basic proline-rich protein-like [Monodelphis domestica]
MARGRGGQELGLTQLGRGVEGSHWPLKGRSVGPSDLAQQPQGPTPSWASPSSGPSAGGPRRPSPSGPSQSQQSSPPRGGPGARPGGGAGVGVSESAPHWARTEPKGTEMLAAPGIGLAAFFLFPLGKVARPSPSALFPLAQSTQTIHLWSQGGGGLGGAQREEPEEGGCPKLSRPGQARFPARTPTCLPGSGSWSKGRRSEEPELVCKVGGRQEGTGPLSSQAPSAARGTLTGPAVLTPPFVSPAVHSASMFPKSQQAAPRHRQHRGRSGEGAGSAWADCLQRPAHVPGPQQGNPPNRHKPSPHPAALVPRAPGHWGRAQYLHLSGQGAARPLPCPASARCPRLAARRPRLPLRAVCGLGLAEESWPLPWRWVFVWPGKGRGIWAPRPQPGEALLRPPQPPLARSGRSFQTFSLPRFPWGARQWL